MSLRQFTNDAETTLASSISSTSNSLTVFAGSGSLFPSLTGSQFFTCTIIKAGVPSVYEIIKVTSRSTDTFIISRAQEGTGALAWNAADIVSLRPTAGCMQGFTQFDDLQTQSSLYGIDTGSANAYVVSLTPALTTIAAGTATRWIAGHTNTSTVCTFYNGAASGNLLLANGQPPIPGMITTGAIYISTWNGSYFQLDGSLLVGSGSFTVTYNGGTTSPTGTAYYSVYGPYVSLVLPTLTATSNSANFYYTGLPSFLVPGSFFLQTLQSVPMSIAIDHSVFISGTYASFSSSPVINFGINSSLSGWTATGTKSVGGTIMYRLY